MPRSEKSVMLLRSSKTEGAACEAEPDAGVCAAEPRGGGYVRISTRA